MGAGVEGAAVTLTLADGAVIGPVQSNEIGDFTISAERPLTGKATVTVHKEHFKDMVFEVELGGAEGAPFVDASMRGALALTGKVTSRQAEQPVAGAEIIFEVGYDERDTKSDETGAFRMEDLPPGPVTITVKAEGFARERRQLEAVESAGPQTLALSPERIVHLRITDDAERPIAGVGVECVDQEARDYRHLLTDDAGKTTIRGLRFDAPELSLRLSHEKYVSSPDFDRTIALPSDVLISTHGLTMQIAGTITGVVTDSASGKPLYGARLTAGRVLSDRLPRAWTDVEGRFQLIGVTPGNTPVTVHFAEYAPQIKELHVAAGEENPLDFALSSARTVAGRVVDGDAKPIGGVHLLATRWAGHETLGLQALSDADGRFVLADAPRDAFELSLYAPGYKPLLDQNIGAQQDQFEFVLKADPRTGAGVAGSGPAVGSAVPAFSVRTLDGQTIALADLKGKVVLLDFWATWCGPCVGEIPNLLAVHDAFSRRGDFLMLSISIEEDAARVRNFAESRKMNWPQATAADRGAADAATSFEVSAIPALYLIDREGRIAARDLRGASMLETVRAQLGDELDK